MEKEFYKKKTTYSMETFKMELKKEILKKFLKIKDIYKKERTKMVSYRNNLREYH